MPKGSFSNDGEEIYTPMYGGVNWKRRLNDHLEELDGEIKPVFYREGNQPKMQVTQENTFLYVNSFVDELDLIIIDYEYDEDGLATNYFRETIGEEFDEVCKFIGWWATKITTLYPIKEVVERYEDIHQTPDYFPESWL